MRLLHFSQKPTITRPIETVPQVSDGQSLISMWKPRGLWVTPEGDEHDWSWWARAENFRLEDLRHAQEVRMRDDARVLHLESPQDMIEFAATYPGRLAGTLAAHLGGEYAGIDWQAVSREYHGIIVAPYQWSLRLDHRFMWYYPWDCATGCIWDADAIAAITLRPDVRVVTEAEIRRGIHARMRFTQRKMKKTMRRMREATS